MKPPLTAPNPYFACASRNASRDFLRSAVARWTTPDFAALSNADVRFWSAFEASCFFPAPISCRYARSRVCRRDLMLRLCNFLRALLRIRRSADFVFGINQFLVNCSEPDTLCQP